MELVDQIMTGADLRIFLRPDPAFVKGGNLYHEFLSLPHIFTEGTTFWGHTLTHHLKMDERVMKPFQTYEGEKLVYPYKKSGFFYSNYRGGMFGEINIEDFGIGSYTSGYSRLDLAYQEHQWIFKNGYSQISGREAIENAVQHGQKLKVLVEIKKEKWATRHPRYYIGEVFLPYLFDSGKTFFLCSPFFYMEAFLSRRAMDAAQKKFINMLGIVSEQYLIDMDGRYSHLGDAQKWGKEEWLETNELKVFAEIEDTTIPIRPILENKPSRSRNRIWKLFHTQNTA